MVKNFSSRERNIRQKEIFKNGSELKKVTLNTRPKISLMNISTGNILKWVRKQLQGQVQIKQSFFNLEFNFTNYFNN